MSGVKREVLWLKVATPRVRHGGPPCLSPPPRRGDGGPGSRLGRCNRAAPPHTHPPPERSGPLPPGGELAPRPLQGPTQRPAAKATSRQSMPRTPPTRPASTATRQTSRATPRLRVLSRHRLSVYRMYCQGAVSSIRYCTSAMIRKAGGALRLTTGPARLAESSGYAAECLGPAYLRLQAPQELRRSARTPSAPPRRTATRTRARTPPSGGYRHGRDSSVI